MANLKVDDVKALIGAKGGVFQPNRFEIDFNPPGGAFGGNELSLLCESTSIPGKQINTFEYPFKSVNNETKVPNGYAFDDVECVFMLTNDFDLKLVFEDWLREIITDDYRLTYAPAYERDVSIYALNQKHERTLEVKLLNAFPITINAIDLNMATDNEIGKLSVTFTYSNVELTPLGPNAGRAQAPPQQAVRRNMVLAGGTPVFARQNTLNNPLPNPAAAIIGFDGDAGIF